MSKPCFSYWKLRALGRHIRILLAYAGVDHENREYEMHLVPDSAADMSDWGNDKAKMSANGENFANLPGIKDGDFYLSESVAVTRYIAAKWCPALLGSTPEIGATADMLYSVWHPIRHAGITVTLAF
jgi:glutathione S-transferase